MADVRAIAIEQEPRILTTAPECTELAGAFLAWLVYVVHSATSCREGNTWEAFEASRISRTKEDPRRALVGLVC